MIPSSLCLAAVSAALLTQSFAAGPVYTNGSAQYPYLGCYADHVASRLLPFEPYADPTQNTNGKCQNACSKAGYAFAGTEYHQECWCGHNSPPGAQYYPESDQKCTYSCPGDLTQACGGDGGYISVYYNSTIFTPNDQTYNQSDFASSGPWGAPQIVQSVSNYNYIGCYSEGTNGRALTGSAPTIPQAGGSVEYCASQCADFTYFGVEYANECYCGNTLNAGSSLVSGTDPALTLCSMVCGGNSLEYCGGPNRLNMYQSNQTTPSTSTPGALQTVGNFNYLGCYNDTVSARALTSHVSAGNTMTLESCASTCSAYAYFGTEYARECYCGNSLQSGSVLSLADGCNMACAGDSSELCGGPNRLSLYGSSSSIGNTISGPITVSSAGAFSSLGCYNDSIASRALSGKYYGDGSNMTVQNCAAFCSGFTYFGVEYAAECYCANTIGAGSVLSAASSRSDCNMACSGNQTELCGGRNRLNVYQAIPDLSSSTSISPTTSISGNGSSSAFPTTSATIANTATNTGVDSTDSNSTSSFTPAITSSGGLDFTSATGAVSSQGTLSNVSSPASDTGLTFASITGNTSAGGISSLTISLPTPNLTSTSAAVVDITSSFSNVSLTTSTIGSLFTSGAANISSNSSSDVFSTDSRAGPSSAVATANRSFSTDTAPVTSGNGSIPALNTETTSGGSPSNISTTTPANGSSSASRPRITSYRTSLQFPSVNGSRSASRPRITSHKTSLNNASITSAPANRSSSASRPWITGHNTSLSNASIISTPGSNSVPQTGPSSAFSTGTSGRYFPSNVSSISLSAGSTSSSNSSSISASGTEFSTNSHASNASSSSLVTGSASAPSTGPTSAFSSGITNTNSALNMSLTSSSTSSTSAPSIGILNSSLENTLTSNHTTSTSSGIGEVSNSPSTTFSFTATSTIATATATATALSCPSSNGTIYDSPSGANFNVECYIDHFGGDTQKIALGTFKDCVDLCGTTKGCVAVSYTGNTCYTKNQIFPGLTNNVVYGATRLMVPMANPAIGNFSYVGCFNDSVSARALISKFYYGSSTTTNMTEELCAAFCHRHALFGVEYGQECYCGNELQHGSTIVDSSSCNFPCPGDSTELCGAGDRLNLYQYNSTLARQGTASPASSNSTSSSTSASSAPSTASSDGSQLKRRRYWRTMSIA